MRAQELKPRKRHDLDGFRMAIRRGGGAVHLWRLGKTAIWLQKCGFTRVLGTLAKRRPPVRPKELKPRKRHDLEGFWRSVCGGGAAPLALR